MSADDALPGGTRAGGERNDRMLDWLEHEPDGLVIAFHDEALEKSRGTNDCIVKARRRGFTVDIVSHLGGTFTLGTPALVLELPHVFIAQNVLSNKKGPAGPREETPTGLGPRQEVAPCDVATLSRSAWSSAR